MANEEHLYMLNHGVGAWNKWRGNNPGIRPDLNKAELIRANLRRANLRDADLNGAHLLKANLSEVDLGGAILSAANLDNANLEGAGLFETVFADVDLSATKGLKKCKHLGPSIIDHRSLMKSGPLPEVFLRGCGLPDDLIEYLPSFRHDPIQFYSCFISYSHKDEEFAKRLHADLQDNGVRCWFAPEDLKIGDEIWDSIDSGVRIRDKLLVILSEHSIESTWVKDEVNKAYAEERRRGKKIIFPIRLDESAFNTDKAWVTKISENRLIGDFRNWKDHNSYLKSFKRLMRDLKDEGKTKP